MKCCDITASKLKNRVILQRIEIVEDGSGGSTRTWQTVQSIWAYLVQTGGGERYQQERLTATANFKAIIRYRADVSPVNRIVFQGVAYQIRSVDDIEFAHKFLQLTLESGVAT